MTSSSGDDDVNFFSYTVNYRCGLSWGGESHLSIWRLHVQQVEEVNHIYSHFSGASMFSRLKRFNADFVL